MSDRGEIIHGEVSSANASAGVAFTLYDTRCVARALASTEILVITDYTLLTASGGDSAIGVDDAAGSAALITAGKRVVRGTYVANGGVVKMLETPFHCPRGITPKAFAPAGQCDAIITGYILRA